MASVRAERLVNLVLCLLSTRQYLTADRIRDLVAGYEDAAGDEAFYRMFERDKAELRDLGIPLEIGKNSFFDTVDGYRIARRDYELGDIDLEPDEAAAVALAARLWESPELTGAARGALRKLRAAGVDVDERASSTVEPRVRASEPSFTPLLDAVHAGDVVRFDYRRSNSSEVTRRTVEPWGVVSWRGRWYVVGHDRDRADSRCFRLSRIVGDVHRVRSSPSVQRPPELNLLDLVTGTPGEHHAPAPTTTARVWVQRGCAQGLRRKATHLEPRELAGLDGDVLELQLYSPEGAAGWLAGFGAHVVVMEPETLRKSVYEVLLAVAALEES